MHPKVHWSSTCTDNGPQSVPGAWTQDSPTLSVDNWDIQEHNGMYMYSVCVCVHAYSVVNNLADFLITKFIIVTHVRITKLHCYCKHSVLCIG